MTNSELMQLALSLNDQGEPYALVTVVRAVAPTSAYLGAQAIILANGTLHGWIGGGCAKGVVIGAAQDAIEHGDPKLVRISNESMQAEDDVEHHAMSCASNGMVELFIQPHSARAALCVVGSTPAADEARFLADRLGIRLVEAPDRAPIALLATQGQGDEEALESALRAPFVQVLMIASRRKAEKLRDVMRLRGIDDGALLRLHAPAGPDAGAKTPAEIAMVAMVGVLALLRGRGHALLDSAPRESMTVVPPRTDVAAVTGRPEASPGSSAPTFINPVCGMAVDMAKPMHVEPFEGTDYYFCCDGCWQAFRREPAKFAAIHHGSLRRAMSA